MDNNKLFDLSGKTALITGSSRGIGKALAVAFARAGALVVVHGIHHDNELDDVVALIKKKGGQAIGLAVDLADHEAVAAFGQKIQGIYGGIDILVLNASTQAYASVEMFEESGFYREFDVNVKASFQLIKMVLPTMKEKKWGRILSIGSMNQWRPQANLAVYAATKSAQANLVLNCAREYAQFGITANNLAPGIIETDRNTTVLADACIAKEFLAGIPAFRFGQPSDLVGPALMICSDAGGYLTGVDMPITGGAHL